MGSQPSTYKTNEYFIVHSDRLKGINWFSKVPQLYITDFATISAYFTLYNLLLYIKILQHYLSVLYTVPPSVVCLIFLTNQLSVSVTEHSTVVDVLERIIYYRT